VPPTGRQRNELAVRTCAFGLCDRGMVCSGSAELLAAILGNLPAAGSAGAAFSWWMHVMHARFEGSEGLMIAAVGRTRSSGHLCPRPTTLAENYTGLHRTSLIRTFHPLSGRPRGSCFAFLLERRPRSTGKRVNIRRDCALWKGLGYRADHLPQAEIEIAEPTDGEFRPPCGTSIFWDKLEGVERFRSDRGIRVSGRYQTATHAPTRNGKGGLLRAHEVEHFRFLRGSHFRVTPNDPPSPVFWHSAGTARRQRGHLAAMERSYPISCLAYRDAIQILRAEGCRYLQLGRSESRRTVR